MSDSIHSTTARAVAVVGRGRPAGGIVPARSLRGHALPEVGIRVRRGDVNAVEREPGCLDPLVVTRDTVRVEHRAHIGPSRR